MNAAQIHSFVNFIDNWLLPEPEVKRRIALINETVADYSTISLRVEKFFKLQGTERSLKPVYIMAHLKAITDELLSDYVQGLVEFFFYLAYKKTEHSNKCETLLRQSFNILKEFLESSHWRQLIISMEVTGQEYQVVNGVTIPFTPEAILMHIDRIRAFPITTNDIAKIKASFSKYNYNLYNGIEKDRSEPTLSQLIKQKDKFKIDPDMIYKIHTACTKHKVIECELIEFIFAITFADFSETNCDTIQRTQYLIFRLSRLMGKDWYDNVALSRDWTKNQISRHGKLHETNNWASEIYKLTQKQSESPTIPQKKNSR